MSRLITFIVFLIGLTIAMNLSKFKQAEVPNNKFDFEKTAAANLAKKQEIEKLRNPVEEVAVVEVAKPEGPLVELSTPILQAGHDLYKKCVVCHGKRGQGKPGQKAPAIGGQYDWYTETQINHMRSGQRINKVMNPYISKLSDDDVKALAAYIAELPYMGQK